MNIGENINQIRLSKGISTFQLSHSIGTSETLIKRIEDGSADPSIGTLQRICEVLEVKLVSLLDGYIEDVIVKVLSEKDIKDEWINQITKTISSVEAIDESQGVVKLKDFKIDKYIADLSNKKYLKGYIEGLKYAVRLLEDE